MLKAYISTVLKRHCLICAKTRFIQGNLRCFDADCYMSRNTHFVCYFWAKKFICANLHAFSIAAFKLLSCPPDIFHLTQGLCWWEGSNRLLVYQSTSNISLLCHSCTGIPEPPDGRNFREKSRDHDTSVIPPAANITLSPRPDKVEVATIIIWQPCITNAILTSDSTLLNSLYLVLLIRTLQSNPDLPKLITFYVPVRV